MTSSSGGEAALAAAIEAGPHGLAARAALAQAGLLLGAGAGGLRRRLRMPCSNQPAGRSAMYVRLWQQAADQVGAECHDLGQGLLQLRRGDRSTWVWDSLVPLDDPVVLRVAVDKPVARALLHAAGLRVPEQVVCGGAELARARDMLLRSGEVVVKPAASGGGRGVTCGVRTAHELTCAFAFALRSSERVVVEQRVSGEERRLLVLGDDVVGAVQRRPPAVVGDGRHTIGQLIDRLNVDRDADPLLAGLYPVTFDLDLVYTLRRAGCRLSAIPGPGVRVVVKTAVNENGPTDNARLTVDPELARTAQAATRAVGSRFAAVEIIGDAVVEVNTTPGLHYHYGADRSPAEPSIATQVLEHLLTRAASPEYADASS